MEKIFSFSAQANNIGDALNHFNSTILCYTVFCLVITFQEFCSCFSSLFRVVLLVFTTPFKKLDSAVTSSKVTNYEGLLEEDAEIVLGTLMNFCSQIGDNKNIDEVELVEVLDSFDETKPSVEEVQEAFDVFDENGDGYIDANELKKVICKMGFLEFSVEDCQRMIVPFDDNIDGRIELGEFVKLMDHIFQ